MLAACKLFSPIFDHGPSGPKFRLRFLALVPMESGPAWGRTRAMPGPKRHYPLPKIFLLFCIFKSDCSTNPRSHKIFNRVSGLWRIYLPKCKAKVFSRNVRGFVKDLFAKVNGKNSVCGVAGLWSFYFSKCKAKILSWVKVGLWDCERFVFQSEQKNYFRPGGRVAGLL